MFSFVNDGGSVTVAESWQEWGVRYDSGREEILSSDRSGINLWDWLGGSKSFGVNSFVDVKIRTKYLGGLSDWGTQIKVSTSASIYLGLPSSAKLLGTIETQPVLFSMGDPAGKEVYPEFWVCGSQQTVNELKAKQVGTEDSPWILQVLPFSGVMYEMAFGKAFLNIESLLDEMGGRHPEFRLYVKAQQKWAAVQWPGIETSSKTYDIPFEAPFSTNAPITYTAPFTNEGGWTTQSGTPGIVVKYSYTFTVTETTYTLRTTTITVPRTTIATSTSDFIPVPPPNLWKLFVDWWNGLLKANPWLTWIPIGLAVLLGLFVLLVIVKAFRWAAQSPNKK
jgi:hypothetical protein